MNQLPVVIVGGGLVGGLCALLLAQGGIEVTVLDAAPLLAQDQVLSQPNPRVLALSLASIHLLQTVGVWQRVKRHMPYSGMQVWNRDGMGEIRFGQASDSLPLQSDWLGSMVEPSIINLAIQQQLQTQIADYRDQVQVKRIEQLNSAWRIHLADGTQLDTALLIGADGAHSMVREQALMHLDVLDYDQSAISCAVKTTLAHAHVARQIFLPTGPLAFLPMASLNAAEQGHWQSIVWTMPSDHADEMAALSDAKFCDKLTEHSLQLLGTVTAVQSRAQFPLKARAAQRYVQQGLALIGDAAHTIHPLAGQGVNIGCLDAAVLADVLLQDHARGTWAHLQTLQRYEHLRKGQNDAMMHSMSAIGLLQRLPFSSVRWARDVGLKQVDSHDWLKSAFLHQASGVSALQGTRYRAH